jgi:hypothetical protein
VARLEAALGPALAQHPRRHNRRGKALDDDRAEIFVIEQTGGQPPRVRPDHHGPGLSQRLQTRREVRRLADYAALAGLSLADQIAYDDHPGADPDPRLQALRPRQPTDGIDQREAGAHRALGIVLVGARIAEIGEHAVAHVIRDKPATAFDDRGAAAVIGADHRPPSGCAAPGAMMWRWMTCSFPSGTLGRSRR